MSKELQPVEPADANAFHVFKEAVFESRLSAKRRAMMSEQEVARAERDHIWLRQAQVSQRIVPWLAGIGALRSVDVLEIGCGTGSSGVGLGPHVRSVTGVDIDSPSIELARLRASAFGADNVIFKLTSDPLDAVYASRYGLVLLYAVLEHMLTDEREALLAQAWAAVEPGGCLVVCETPNRLAWFDYHTAQLPFFGALPPHLQSEWATRSPRKLFAESLKQARERGGQEDQIKLARWGLGISFHEFELAIGPDVHQYVIADGLEPDLLKLYPLRLEDTLLLEYFARKPLNQSLAFARQPLNLVIRKPDESKPPFVRRHTADHLANLASSYGFSQELNQRLARAQRPDIG